MASNFGGIPPAFGFDKPIMPVGEGGSYIPKGENIADIDPTAPSPLERTSGGPDVFRPSGDGDPVGEGGSYVPKQDDVAGLSDRVDINKKLFS